MSTKLQTVHVGNVEILPLGSTCFMHGNKKIIDNHTFGVIYKSYSFSIIAEFTGEGNKYLVTIYDTSTDSEELTKVCSYTLDSSGGSIADKSLHVSSELEEVENAIYTYLFGNITKGIEGVIKAF